MKYDKDLIVGARYHFRFYVSAREIYECDGSIVGIKTRKDENEEGEDCGWFLPDEGFVAPHHWRSGGDSFRGAFSCLARHLTLIENVAEVQVEHLL